MQNILLVLDGAKPDINTTGFACFIANLTRSKLKAIFIQNIKGEAAPALKQLFALPYVETITAADFPENRKLEEACALHEKNFAYTCLNLGVNHQIQYLRKAEASDIISESRFADLLILSPQISFKEGDDATPSAFVTEILSASECPVAVAPYSFEGIDELVLLYDGGRSAVYAIRQFANLFPQLSNKKLTVLQIDEKPGLAIINRQKLDALLQNHFSSIVYTQMTSDPGTGLLEHLLGKKNIFVIMGAYGRSLLSNSFRHSRADLLMKTTNVPFFIVHH